MAQMFPVALFGWKLGSLIPAKLLQHTPLLQNTHPAHSAADAECPAVHLDYPNIFVVDPPDLGGTLRKEEL